MRPNKIVCMMLLTLWARVGAGVASDGVAAVSAGDFLNFLGVCTHIGQGIDNPSQSAAALTYAGLRNIRDDGNPRHLPDWLSVHEQAGVKGLTQEQQGRLYLNLYLAQFKQGFKYTFIYMLRDTRGSDAGYGMFERDYQPKRSATYLHSLTTILSDDGISPPGWLGYAIPDQPATVHDLLLRKSNGTFELVVWSEKADGTNRVTVDLGGIHPSVKVYDPTIGVTPTQTCTDVRTVPLTLSDHPVIIEI